MKNLISTALLAGMLFQLAFAQQIDATQSTVNFELSNLAVNTVEGSFSDMTGTVVFDPNALSQAHFEVCVAAKTVNTGSTKRDEHLRKEDFFDVPNYPDICFTSSSIKAQGSTYLTTGTLSMHGVNKQVEIPFTYTNGVLEGSLTIERKDYGVGADYSSFTVGNEVEIRIRCVLRK